MTELLPEQIDATIEAFIERTLLAGRAVARDENLLLSGLVDSLGVISLVSFLEQEFVLKVPFDDVTIENFQTVDAIAGYVRMRVSAHAG